MATLLALGKEKSNQVFVYLLIHLLVEGRLGYLMVLQLTFLSNANVMVTRHFGNPEKY